MWSPRLPGSSTVPPAHAVRIRCDSRTSVTDRPTRETLVWREFVTKLWDESFMLLPPGAQRAHNLREKAMGSRRSCFEARLRLRPARQFFPACLHKEKPRRGDTATGLMVLKKASVRTRP